MSAIIRSCTKAFPGEYSSFRGEAVEKEFPFAASTYYLSLISEKDYSDPIYRQCVPSDEELQDIHGISDPFCEEDKQFIPRFIHRYPQRGVLITTNVCAMHCRHCMRKRQWKDAPFFITKEEVDNVVRYVETHAINDVIISGGDPLMLPSEMLQYIVHAFSQVQSVQVLRIGTRIPVVDPERITDEIAQVCSLFPTLFVLTHFNHPRECTKESLAAIRKLQSNGAIIMNQNVLLKDINDDAATLTELYTTLLSWGIKPYYLHHCDLTYGTTHFWVAPEKGVALLKALQGHISGLALPYYAIDLPGGKGKILLGPETMFDKDGETYYFTTYTGERVAYRL